jgi:hypothetical protein
MESPGLSISVVPSSVTGAGVGVGAATGGVFETPGSTKEPSGEVVWHPETMHTAANPANPAFQRPIIMLTIFFIRSAGLPSPFQGLDINTSS